MNRFHRSWPLVKQAGGGLLWALFMILAPFEALFLGALIWIPVFIWREKLRASRHGFWPGAAVRYPVMIGVVVLALSAPLKPEDKRIGPLGSSEVSLGELVEAGVIYDLVDPRHRTIAVRLESRTPTRRELMTAIAEQTGFKTSIFHCSVGSTLLFGGRVGRISVSDRPTNGLSTPLKPRD